MAFNVSKAFDHEKDHNTYKPGTTDVKPYSFDYSELAKAVATIIESNYTDVNFTIFETRQFNEFMNLQIGKNTIMVSIVKLPTEAPVSQEKRWMTIPEKSWWILWQRKSLGF